MGKAAASCADVVILTSDNPRSENPDCIINEIRHGIPDNFAGLFLEPDRKNAIAMAVKMAAPGDAVLIAGKGHENYQEINGVKYSFDDREELKNICSVPDIG